MNIHEVIKLNERLMPDKDHSKFTLKRVYNSLDRDMYRDGNVKLIFDVNQGNEYVCRIWVSRLIPKDSIYIQFDIFNNSEEEKAFTLNQRNEVRKLATKELERFIATLPLKPK